MRIGICDDNEIYLKYIHHITEQILEGEPIQTSCEMLLPQQMKELIAEYSFPYDILITDVDLGIANAIDLVKDIQVINPGCVVIFISNFLQFAPDVYEVVHAYFVLKSDIEIRLPKALDRAFSILRDRLNTFLTISYQHQQHQIPLADIIYLDSLGRYLTVHTQRLDYICILPLKEVEKELSNSFARCHKSFIINFKYISSLQQNNCILTTGSVIPISHTYNKSFFTSYREFIVKTHCKIKLN